MPQTSLNAKAQLALAEKTLATNQKLLKQNFISQNAFDSSESNMNVSRGSVMSAQAQVRLAQNALKDAEGRLGVCLGANGAIYAARRELVEPLPAAAVLDERIVPLRSEKTVIDRLGDVALGECVDREFRHVAPQ